jgi:cell wall assembly regulator SMI1
VQRQVSPAPAVDGTRVSDAPTILSVELLEQLNAQWQAVGAPITEHLRPGLTDTEIDRLTRPLDLVVPEEARVWWRWHDGATGTGRADRQLIGTTWTFLSLAESVAEAEWQRKEAIGLRGSQADDIWPAGLLPIASDMGGNIAAIDCSQASTPSPVYYVDSDVGLSESGPGSQSIAELVRWWIDAIADGATTFDSDAGRWRYDRVRLPPQRARTGLV